MNCGDTDATAVPSKEHQSRCSHWTDQMTEITKKNVQFIGSCDGIQHEILSTLPVQYTATSWQFA